MKRLIRFTAALMLLFALSGCEKEPVLHLGLNYRIMDIQPEQQTLTAQSLDRSAEQEPITLLCEGVPVIYCNFDTQEVWDIQFRDLLVGDAITVDAYEQELSLLNSQGTQEALHIEQIQLQTQRLNN